MSSLRVALRGFRRDRGFFGLVVLILALGLGVEALVVGLVADMMAGHLPAEDLQSLVYIRVRNTRTGRSMAPSTADWLLWRDQSRHLEEVAAATPQRVILKEDRPRWLSGYRVSTEFFSVLGSGPIEGRVFVRDDSIPHGEKVTVISHRLARQLASETSTVGMPLLLDDGPHTVVGVLPVSFEAGLWAHVDVWVPLIEGQEETGADPGGLFVWARLREGSSTEQAHHELRTLSSPLERREPFDPVVTPSLELLLPASNVRGPLVLALLAPTLVLALVFSNVMGLFVARSMRRQKELEVRLALGASRWRLVRQQVVELAAATFAGSVLAIPTALLLFRVLQMSEPGIHPLGWTMIQSMLLGTAALAVVSPLAFGLLPAYRLVRLVGSSPLGRDGGRYSLRLRRGLVAAQVAFALAVAVIAGVVASSAIDSLRAEDRSNLEGVLSATILSRESMGEGRGAFWMRALEEVGTLPGVERIALVGDHPLLSRPSSVPIEIEGNDQQSVRASAARYRVSAEYFELAGIPILAGEIFDDELTSASVPVVVASQRWTERYFPAGEALGARVGIHTRGGDVQWREIVAVVGSVASSSGSGSGDEPLYLPLDWNRLSRGYILVRASQQAGLVPAVLDRLAAVDPLQPVDEVRTLESVVDQEAQQTTSMVALLSALGLFAMLLAIVGVYGTTSQAIGQRHREVAVRTAVGARPLRLALQLCIQDLRVVLAGGLVGLVLSLIMVGLLNASLFGISTPGFAPLIAAAFVLLLAAAAATLIPVRGALRLDPSQFLRSE